MKTYVVTATDAAGRRETFGREAASIEHLRAQLERDGYADIEFHDDELSALLRNQRPDAARPHTQRELRLEATLRKGSNPALLWGAAVRSNAVLLLALIGLGVFGAWSGRGWLLGLAIALVLGWVWLIRKGLASAGLYDDLLRAFARGEWEAAEALIDRLEASPATRDNEQVLHDLVFRRAGLLARTGQLDAAIAMVQPLRDSVHSGNGMFENRLATLYYLADRPEEFLEHIRLGFEASDRSDTQKLDVAFAHARLGDIAQATTLLAGIRRDNLTSLHEGVARVTEGICARRAGDPALACERLASGYELLSAFAANPAIWPVVAIAVAHRALALAEAGQVDEARAVLAPWRETIDACLDRATCETMRRDLPGALA